MIRGKVNQALEARFTVEFMDGGGQIHAVEVVLDTGFTGALTLPPDLIRPLGLTLVGGRIASLANGELVRLNSWRGTVLWHGRPRRILVLQSDGVPLLGMSLLRGSRVTLDVLDAGDVVIEELPAAP